LTLPFCSSEEFIDRYIQVPIVAKAAKLQKLRLRSLFPDLVQDHKAHRLSQFSLQNLDTEKSAVPYPLEWAFAVVRSRCFSVASDWFAMLPMIDMCNHAHEPNAELDAKPKATKTFDLVAKSSIPKECEITISYSDWHANQRLYSQYGFVQENNVNDLISLAPVIIDSNIAEDLRGKMATESCLQSAIKVLTISFIEISSQ
jgi:SET domain